MPFGKYKAIQLWDSISPLSEWSASRKLRSAGEDVGKGKSLFTASWNGNKWKHSSNQYSCFSKATRKTRIAIWLSQTTRVYAPKEFELIPWRYFPSIFTVALYTISKKGNEPRCLSTDKWVRNCSIYLKIKSEHLQQNGWNWKVFCQTKYSRHRKTNITFLSHADPRFSFLHIYKCL